MIVDVRRRYLFYTILLLAISLAACTIVPTNPTSELTEAVPAATVLAISTATSAASPAAVPPATKTLTAIAPTATQKVATPDTLLEPGEPWPTSGTSSGTPTTTPEPTLAPAQEGALLATLMATNGGCDLPCWWGVTPGVTGAQAARDWFAAQGIDDWVVTNNSPPYTTMALSYPRPGSATTFRDLQVTFWLDAGQIYFISVDGSLLDESLRPIVVDVWALYGPAAMLSQYGQPPFIELAPLKNSSYYRLIFSYDALGVEIVYVLPFDIQANGRASVCLDLESMDYIYLALYQPGQISRAPIGILPDRPDNHTSWEAATGLNRADLAQLLFDSSTQPCFSLP